MVRVSASNPGVRVRVRVRVRVMVRVRVSASNPNPNPNPNPSLNPNPNPNPNPVTPILTLTLTIDLVEQVRGLAELFRERGLLEKSAADTHGLFEWRMLADVFQSFPPRKFRQSAADPP